MRFVGAAGCPGDAWNPLSRYLLFLVLVLGCALAVLEVARRGARTYEHMLVARVTSGLEVLGYDWARIRADGLMLELHGHAPDEFARETALEAARTAAPMASVTSFATATLAPPERRDPLRVELLRDRHGITVTGQTSSRGMRTRLNAALAAGGPDLTVNDLTGIHAAPPPSGWGPEIAVASLAALSLPNAYVVMEPGSVLIDGQAAGVSERRRLSAALQAVAGGKVVLNLRIRIPARLIAPFAFTAERAFGATLLLERCAVRSEAEQSVLRARLLSLGQAEHVEPCRIGLGGPGGDWPAAIGAGLDALMASPAGRLDIEYRTVRLTGYPPTDAETFSAVAQRMAAALPEGYEADTVLHGEDIASRTSLAREQFWMNLGYDARGVTISGQVTDRATEAALLAYASALFGEGAVRHALSQTGMPAPGRWQIAAMALLDQLALVGGGEARLAGDRLSFRGKVADPALVGQIHRELSLGLPEYRVSTVVEVDLPRVLSAIRLPVERCAAELNAINKVRRIDFTINSARLTEESGPILDDMVRQIRHCRAEPIEIAGHTDSHGREEFNQRLSQARAEAVMIALMNRGIRAGRLRARGYGEAAPIADNDTEEGRIRNRRIEFRPAGQSAGRPRHEDE